MYFLFCSYGFINLIICSSLGRCGGTCGRGEILTMHSSIYQKKKSEKLVADEFVCHKSCFRCEQCKCVLKLGTYAALEGKYYCKPHFKQVLTIYMNI